MPGSRHSPLPPSWRTSRKVSQESKKWSMREKQKKPPLMQGYSWFPSRRPGTTSATCAVAHRLFFVCGFFWLALLYFKVSRQYVRYMKTSSWICAPNLCTPGVFSLRALANRLFFICGLSDWCCYTSRHHFKASLQYVRSIKTSSQPG